MFVVNLQYNEEPYTANRILQTQTLTDVGFSDCGMRTSPNTNTHQGTEGQIDLIQHLGTFLGRTTTLLMNTV